MDKRDFKQGGGRRGGGQREVPEFDQKIIDLARVTRVMAGGKRMRFRACVAIGDKKGRVGMGMGKGADVTLAVTKAVNQAKKHLVTVPIVYDTIPHRILIKFKAARVLLKPAPKGTGIKAGGAVRMVMELSGVPNVVGKIMGSNNKINNVKALIEALSSFKPVKVPHQKKEAAQPVKETVEKKESATITSAPAAVAAEVKTEVKKKAPAKEKKPAKPTVKKPEEKTTSK